MQYLISVIDDGEAEAAGRTESATQAEMAAVTAFNKRIQADGHWVFAGGLAAPEVSTVVDNRSPETQLSVGPVNTGQTFVAGIWVWEAADLDEALRLATEASKACNRKLEVRPFLSL